VSLGVFASVSIRWLLLSSPPNRPRTRLKHARTRFSGPSLDTLFLAFLSGEQGIRNPGPCSSSGSEPGGQDRPRLGVNEDLDVRYAGLREAAEFHDPEQHVLTARDPGRVAVLKNAWRQFSSGKANPSGFLARVQSLCYIRPASGPSALLLRIGAVVASVVSRSPTA
jgi:hypothetical protein